jgi:putative transposase
MGQLPRSRPDESTYFINAQTYQRKRLLQSERCARLLLAILYHYRKAGKYLLHEFVVMPNHFHLLITPITGVTLERALQLIKGRFSFEAGKKFGMQREIWQRGFYDHRIRNLAEYFQSRTYIHANPVKAGLCTETSEYRYSSAYPGFKLDPIPQRLKPLEMGTSTQS